MGRNGEAGVGQLKQRGRFECSLCGIMREIGCYTLVAADVCLGVDKSQVQMALIR